MIFNLSTFHRSRLPHVSPLGGTFFITFRLADSLPQSIVGRLKNEYFAKVRKIKHSTGSLKEQSIQLKSAKREYFGRFEHQLDRYPYGDCVLKDPKCAFTLEEQLWQYADDWYGLQAYCIMPNHVHLLLNFVEQIVTEDDCYQSEEALAATYVPLHKALQRIKGASARYIKKYLVRQGTLWQKDSYDHWIRHDEKWANFYYYILNNPAKAGLVPKGETWPYSFGKYENLGI